MAIYPGPIAPPVGMGVATKPVCFTGAAAVRMLLVIPGAGLFLGALVGLGVGVLVAIATGPELITKFVAGAFGAVIGALIGLWITASAISGGICPCPAGRFGFCITLVFMRGPFGPPVPSPPFVNSAPAQCTVLVPAGCP